MITREELGPHYAAAIAARTGGGIRVPDAAGGFSVPDAADSIPVPEASGGPATRDLAEALDQRRSIRTYARAPIPRTVLETVVEAGLAVDRELWGGGDLGVVVLADRVSPLAPGVYACSPGLIRRAPLAAMSDHVFQPDLAAAAAVVVVRGDLEAAVRRHGPHGHRRLLTRAGAVVAACHLAALRAGLHGCPFDGLLPEGADRVRDLSLFALALGLPEAGAGADPARRSV